MSLLPRTALRTLHLLAAACCTIGVASAGVLVVDDQGGPGVDFTNLPSAVALSLIHI